MAARKRSIKSDLARVDAHRITKAEYDEAPELTREMLDRAEIARMASMIEDDVLVEFAQIHHRPNISRAASIASANLSMSRSSL